MTDKLVMNAAGLKKKKYPGLKMPSPEFNLSRLREKKPTGLLSRVERKGRVGVDQIIVNELSKPEDLPFAFAVVSFGPGQKFAGIGALPPAIAAGLDEFTRREFQSERSFWYHPFTLVKDFPKPIPMTKPVPGRRFASDVDVRDGKAEPVAAEKWDGVPDPFIDDDGRPKQPGEYSQFEVPMEKYAAVVPGASAPWRTTRLEAADAESAVEEAGELGALRGLDEILLAQRVGVDAKDLPVYKVLGTVLSSDESSEVARAVEAGDPVRLQGMKTDEIQSVAETLRRFHRAEFEGKPTTVVDSISREDVLNAYVFVVRELRKRGEKIEPKREIDSEAMDLDPGLFDEGKARVEGEMRFLSEDELREFGDPGEDGVEDIEKSHGPWSQFGGSSRYAERIVKRFPEHRVYVEPFMGAASCLFTKEACDIEVLSDLDPEAVATMRYLQSWSKKKEDALAKLQWVASRTTYERAQKLKPNNETERFWKFMYLKRFGYSGLPPYSPAKDGMKIHWPNFARYGDRLKGVKILIQDYRETLKAYDGRNTLFFLDPPYPGEWGRNASSVADGVKFDLAELGRLVSKLKGSYVIAYGDTPEQERALKDVKCDRFSLDLREITTPLRGGAHKTARRYFLARTNAASKAAGSEDIKKIGTDSASIKRVIEGAKATKLRTLKAMPVHEMMEALERFHHKHFDGNEEKSAEGISRSAVLSAFRAAVRDLIGRGAKLKADNPLAREAAGRWPTLFQKSEEDDDRECAPTHASGEKLGRRVYLHEVLEKVRPFRFRQDAITIVGGIANRGWTDNDIDVLIKGPIDEDTLHVLKFRFGRMLGPELSQRVQFLSDAELGGPFTDNVPLGNLMFETVPEFQVKEMRGVDVAKQDDPLQDLPLKPGKRDAVMQLHARGKSVADYTPIIIRRGSDLEIIPIAELFAHEPSSVTEIPIEGIEVWGRDGWERIKRASRHKLEKTKMLRVNVAGGLIDATADHSFFRDGMPIAGADLKVEEMLDVVSSLPPMPQDGPEVDPLWAWVMGFFAAEGNCHGIKARTYDGTFTNGVPALIDRVEAWADKYGLPSHRTNEGKAYRITVSLPLWHDFYWRGPHSDRTGRRPIKRVPHWVFAWGPISRHQFIDGYIAGDGSHAKLDRSAWRFGSISQLLAQGILWLQQNAEPAWDHTVVATHLVLVCPMVKPNHNRTDPRGLLKRIIPAYRSADQAGKKNPNWRHGKNDSSLDKARRRANDPGWIYSPKRWVYDVETETHSFVAGVGKLLAHNTVHGDFRIKIRDYLTGWTLPLQRAGAIKEPITTVAELKAIARNYNVETGNRFLKPMLAPEGLFATPKSRQPDIWLRIEDRVFPPGAAGATKEFPGVIVVIDRPKVEFGQQSPRFHEYFVTDSKLKSGLWFVRMLVGEEEEVPEAEVGRVTPAGEIFWKFSISKLFMASILKPRTVKRKVMPPDGWSWVPQSLEKDVPPEFRYWKKKGTEARKIRDALVNEKIFTERTVGLVDGEFRLVREKRFVVDGGTAIGVVQKQPKRTDYVLSRQSFRGPIVVRAGFSKVFWWLVIDKPGAKGVRAWRVQTDPLGGEERISAVEASAAETRDKALLVLSGDQPPSSKWNPTKATPSDVRPVGKGRAEVLEEKAGFLRLRFTSGPLRGVWSLAAEEPGSPLWELSTITGPGRQLSAEKDESPTDLPEGPEPVAGAVPVRDTIQIWDPDKKRPDIDRTDLRPLANFAPMKPREGFFDPNELIDEWATPEIVKAGLDGEPKLNGLRTEAQVDGRGRTLIYFEDSRDDRSKILPGVAAEVKALGDKIGPFILDTELVDFDEEGNAQPRRTLSRFTGPVKPQDDSRVKLMAFRLVYGLGRNWTADPRSDARPALEKFFKKAGRLKHLELLPFKTVKSVDNIPSLIKWASEQPGGEGAMFKMHESTYTLGRFTSSWSKLKITRSVRAIVVEKIPKRPAPEQKAPARTFVYRCAVGPIPKKDLDDFGGLVKIREEWYTEIGKTFATNVQARVGQTLEVQATEFLVDLSVPKKTVHWFTPVVTERVDARPSTYDEVVDGVFEHEIKRPVEKLLDGPVRLLKAEENDEERFVLGVVSEPKTDSQEDLAPKLEIRNACHGYMEFYRGTGLMHRERLFGGRVRICECWYQRGDTEINGEPVHDGSWLMAWRIVDDTLWKDVKDEKLTGFSIQGSAVREPVK